jgi:hypothetical protein
MRRLTTRIEIRTAGLLLTVFLLAGLTPSLAQYGSGPRHDFYGDLRFRMERDWDSQRDDGSEREDRLRGRIRFRLGYRYDPPNPFALEVRLRTGHTDSQQSPQITIKDWDGNPKGGRTLVFDKWYIAFSNPFRGLWLGRNSLPFWKQNELFLDDDVTLAGAGYQQRFGGANGRFVLNLAYAELPDGMEEFNGKLGGGQFVVETRSNPIDFTLAAGGYVFDGEEGARYLRNGNGDRDYTIWIGSVQARFMRAGQPWTVGIDVMHNSKSYDEDDPDFFTAANRDETEGFVGSIRVGQLRRRGNWLAGYTYARIETLAVNASFAQDDWVRWGDATQTDSSDLKGHEFRGGYALSEKSNVLLRVYLVEAITSEQDGKRARLDLNFKF